jgi:hypothetical protein
MNNTRMAIANEAAANTSAPRRRSRERGRGMCDDERDRLVSMLARLPIAEVARRTGRPVVTLAKLVEVTA